MLKRILATGAAVMTLATVGVVGGTRAEATASSPTSSPTSCCAAVRPVLKAKRTAYIRQAPNSTSTVLGMAYTNYVLTGSHKVHGKYVYVIVRRTGVHGWILIANTKGAI